MKVNVEGTFVVVDCGKEGRVRESSVSALLLADIWKMMMMANEIPAGDVNAALVRKIEGRIVKARRA